jgi:hypothetical protein
MATANGALCCLQTEVSNLKTERESIKELVRASEARGAALQADLETTKQVCWNRNSSGIHHHEHSPPFVLQPAAACPD